MPWKEFDRMSERMKFVARYLDGERMSDLCREFEISRKTGYKFVQRYESLGGQGFVDLSCAPWKHPNQTSKQMEQEVVFLRQQHPTWGARKIKAYLERTKEDVPARSTIHAILDRHELVKAKPRRPRIPKAEGTYLGKALEPNDLWCTDFKGQFRLGNRRYCYPLTVTDLASRFLLACEAFETISEEQCIQVFHQLFREHGLPSAIRSDNGVPFASRSFFGMSKLSVYWIRLGIRIERIAPGHPEENGAHERMHRTLKAETTKPVQSNILSQQEHFDAFREIFNKERPHEALEMSSPSLVYKASPREYQPDLEPLKYPNAEITTRVTKCGKIFINNRDLKIKVTLGVPFGGYNVGISRQEDDIWEVSFMNYKLGYFDLETQKIQIPENPFLQGRTLRS